MTALTHRSLIGATGTLTVFAAASIVRPLPWPLWAAWAVLTAIGVRQATR